MTKSDTPRTDNFYRSHPICEYEVTANAEDCGDWIEFARQLELELLQKTRGLEGWKTRIVICEDSEISLLAQLDQVEQRLEEANRNFWIEHELLKKAEQRLEETRNKALEEAAKLCEMTPVTVDEGEKLVRDYCLERILASKGKK